MGARPPVWIGHARLTASDLDRSADFWRTVGMREVERNEQIVVLELRGGTHLVLLPGTPGGSAAASFDLMVEDLDATRADGSDSGSTCHPSSVDVSIRPSSSEIRTATTSPSTAPHVVGDV